MWYVMHTKTGYELELTARKEKYLPDGLCRGCMVPAFEEVRRTGGVSSISYRKLFPGYILMDTDAPQDVLPALGKRYEFARVLGSVRDEEGVVFAFTPISEADASFLGTLLEDGVLSVSYVEQVKGQKIGRIVGPLAKYGNHITKLEFRKRRAIVEADIFGKHRKIPFGLWTDADPKIPWIERRLHDDNEAGYLLSEMDIGLHPGDHVVDVTGIYGDEVFVVESVNPSQRTFRTSRRMLGGMRRIEMFVDDVERVEGDAAKEYDIACNARSESLKKKKCV